MTYLTSIFVGIILLLGILLGDSFATFRPRHFLQGEALCAGNNGLDNIHKEAFATIMVITCANKATFRVDYTK